MDPDGTGLGQIGMEKLAGLKTNAEVIAKVPYRSIEVRLEGKRKEREVEGIKIPLYEHELILIPVKGQKTYEYHLVGKRLFTYTPPSGK